MKNYASIIWLVILAFTVSGCAHQSTIPPSQGHIKSDESTKLDDADIPQPIKKSVYLPPPKKTTKPQTYSVVVNEVPVKEILFALARESKTNIDIHPGISGNVTLNAVDQTLPAILDRISKQISLIYSYDNNVLSIKPDEPVLRTYKINYVNMERKTVGGISVSNQLASSNATSGGTTTGSSSSTGKNNSNTSVETTSNNLFWDSLIKNIDDILKESDKQVVIGRLAYDTRLQAEYDGDTKGNGKIDVGGSKDKANKDGINSTSNNGAKGEGNQSIDATMSEDAKKSLTSYQTLRAAKIIANKETGILSIRATQKQHESIKEFIDQVQISARRQVMIEATIVEVTLNDEFKSGIDWSRLGPKGLTFNQSLSASSGVTNSALASTASKFVIGYTNNTVLGNLSASISLLEGFGKTKVLSSPKLMVLNSQTAILKVVDNLVYFTVKADTTANQTNTTTTFTTTPNTIPVGVWMSVTPQINENDVVTLDVRPTIARQFGSVKDPNPSLTIPSTIPQVQVREMESVLQIPSGKTVVLGGLMQDEISNNDQSVPEISKLPLIGRLFTAKDDATKKTELIIFLRPTVITNASLESDELKSYKQYLPDQLPAEVTNDESTH